MAENETIIRVSVDASGVEAGTERMKRSWDAYSASQEAAAAVTVAKQRAIDEAVTNGSKASARQINALVQQVARASDSYGLSSRQALEQKAAILGVSNAVAPYIEKMNAVDAATRRAAEAQKEFNAEQARLAANQTFLTSLRTRAETGSMSGADLLEYQARQRGQAADAAPYIAQIRATEAALKQQAEAQRLVNAEEAKATSNQNYLASLKDRAETAGMSATDVLEHDANKRGVGAEAAPHIAEIRAAEAALKQQAEAQRLLNAEEAKAASNRGFVESLKNRAETAGMSSTDVLEHEANKRGVGADAAPHIAQIRAMEAALKQQAEAQRLVNAEEAKASSNRAFIDSLDQRVKTFGKSTAEILEMQAAEKGLTAEAAPLIERLKAQEEQARKAGEGAHEFSLKTAGARRELIVLAHEMAMGNYSRFGGSMMVLAERTDAMSMLMNKTVLSAGAFVGAIAAAAAITYHAREALAEYGDSIEKLHQKTGISTDNIQQWAFATKTVGVNAKDATKELGALGDAQNKAVSGNKDAAKAFAEIGISLADLKKSSPEQLLPRIADAFQQHADSASKAALANELFGASGEDLIPLLDRGSAGLHELRDAAQASGAVIGGETVAKMAALKEQMELAKAKMDAMAMSAKAQLLPTIINLTGAIGDNVAMKPLLEDFYRGVGFIMKSAATAIATVLVGMEQVSEVIATAATVVYYASTGQFKMAVDSAKVGYDNLKKQGEGYSQFLTKLWSNTTPPASPSSGVASGPALKFAKGENGHEKAYRDDAATRFLQQLRDQAAELRIQLSTTDKLTEAQKELAKFNEQIADWKGKTLTADQKSLIAHQDQIRTQLQTNIELEKEVKHRDDIQKLIEKSGQINAQIGSFQVRNREGYGRQLEAFGMGADAQKQAQEINAISREYQRYYDELDKAAAKSGTLGSDTYLAEKQAISDGLQQSLKDFDDYYDALKEKQEDWTNGAATAFANFIDSSHNAAAQTDAAFTKVLGGMADALAEFATTGKLNFSKLADGILLDLNRMASHALLGDLFKNLSNIGGSVAGGMFASHPDVAATTASALPGNALDNMVKLTKGFGTMNGPMNVANLQTAVQNASSLSAINAMVTTMTVGTMIGGGAGAGGGAGGDLGSLLSGLGSSGSFAGDFGFTATGITGSTDAVISGAMADGSTSGMSALMGLAGGLATGGPTDAGAAYLVGEKGPEVWIPNQSGRVIPNHAITVNDGGASQQDAQGISQMFNMNITVPPGTTRATAQQQGRAIMEHATIAMRRNG